MKRASIEEKRAKWAALARAWRAKQKAAGITKTPEAKARERISAGKWKRANPEKVRASALRHYYRHQAKIIARNHEKKIKITYGITAARAREMLAEQGHACPICKRHVKSLRNRDGTVDHCHATGKVRGILCLNCNAGIGQLGDDPRRLRNALEYLMLHEVD